MSSRPLRLDTARLLLRPPQPEDFDRYAALMADEASCRFIGGAVGRNESWRRFLQLGGSWFLQGAGPFSLLEKSDQRWLGYLGPWQPEGWPNAEIAYALHPDSQGQGYALEALVAVMDWVFDALGWAQVHHFISPENTASQRLAMKAGARNLGPGQLPPPWQDVRVDVWGQSQQQWQESRQRFCTPPLTPITSG